jgi:hypothetical protein
MNPKHSPLPWKRGSDGLIFDSRDEYVTDTCGTSLPEGEENQKFIILAVNSHSALLEACRDQAGLNIFSKGTFPEALTELAWAANEAGLPNWAKWLHGEVTTLEAAIAQATPNPSPYLRETDESGDTEEADERSTQTVVERTICRSSEELHILTMQGWTVVAKSAKHKAWVLERCNILDFG